MNRMKLQTKTLSGIRINEKKGDAPIPDSRNRIHRNKKINRASEIADM